MPIEPILILTLPISRNWQLIDINAVSLLRYSKEVLNFNGQTTILKQTPTTNSLFQPFFATQRLTLGTFFIECALWQWLLNARLF